MNLRNVDRGWEIGKCSVGLVLADEIRNRGAGTGTEEEWRGDRVS